MLLQFGKHTNK